MLVNIKVKVYIFVLFVFCFSVEGIFLPSAFKSKLRNSNETDLYEKVWMEYIEKRLETINLHLEKQKYIFSFLYIYNRNFRKKLFRKMPANYKQFLNSDGIQIGVYGKICFSSRGGKEEEHVHPCDKVDLPDWRAFCPKHVPGKYYGSFTLPDSDSDSDSDSKPDGYIVLCRSFHVGSDPDPDPCTESFPNCYCTHFRDRYLSQGQISIPIPYTSIRGSESGSEPM